MQPGRLGDQIEMGGKKAGEGQQEAKTQGGVCIPLTPPEGLWEDQQLQGGEQRPREDTDSVPICKWPFRTI